MNRRDVIKKLEAGGYTLKRHGASHDIYWNGEKAIPVKRGKVDESDARYILKEAGLH